MDQCFLITLLIWLENGWNWEMKGNNVSKNGVAVSEIDMLHFKPGIKLFK